MLHDFLGFCLEGDHVLRNYTLPLLHVDHSCFKFIIYNIDVCIQNTVGHRCKVQIIHQNFQSGEIQ